jgi:general secretion pathway protein A
MVAFKFSHPADDDFEYSAGLSALEPLAPGTADRGIPTMYQTHFQLRQRPFPATPDPARYYPATSHERAIARLLDGLNDGEGVLLLTGPPGAGKTLLCHCLLERLGSGRSIVFVTNSHVGSRAGLLQALLYDLSLPYEGRGEQEMRLAVTDHLLRGYAEGQSTILVLDEAQHLTPDLLEELRLLGNLEARSGKAIQVVLVGQPGLLETLRRPELVALAQRVAIRAEVQPLALQEAADYLLHHVRVSGGRSERLFADEALELLSRQTRGVPRLLNQAAHQALLLAAEAGAAQVDAEAAIEALALLGLTEEIEDSGSVDRLSAVIEEGLAVHDPTASQEESSEGEVSAMAETDETSCRLILSASRSG